MSSADTVESNATGNNPDAYVRGNPETMTDPTRHYPIDMENVSPYYSGPRFLDSTQSQPPVADDYQAPVYYQPSTPPTP